MQEVHGAVDVGGADELAVVAPRGGAELGAEVGRVEAITGGQRQAELGGETGEEAI